MNLLNRLSDGARSSEFGVTVLAAILPLAIDLSDTKFLGVCMCAAAYSIARGLAKKS